MNKDYKLMGGLVPVILILCIGLYGIPVLGSQSDSQVNSVAYNGTDESNATVTNNTVASDDSDADDDSTQTSTQVTSSRSSNSGSTSNTNTNTGNTQTPSEPTPEPETPPEPEPDTSPEINIV
ncbi:hypothetical protein [Methanobacterium sp. BAmetb5]|uniref:hypothetical protein n=1 Tax=Methanobacterium sp. BAmetb5 TaxID=2025351 RepID=UPI000E8B8EDB|nr:hypothetical protein [Methanobacterium sp. BAmetb5]AXV40763.1 MAG: hypothetical protein CIT02_10805 [Methanobacterium sp. BAmetb5]